jgi:molybdopterin-guanine dinucleotide biosynthesis protein A
MQGTTGAVVLAGGRLERHRFLGVPSQIQSKALLPVAGQPLLSWSLKAITAVDSFSSVVVVGHPEAKELVASCSRARFVPEAGGIAENLWAGLEALGECSHVLILSGDLPLLTPFHLESLLEGMPEADFVFPIVERGVIKALIPDRWCVFVKTQEGWFTGCSAGLVKRDRLLERRDWVDRVLRSRRNVVRLAGFFGVGFALKALLGLLSLRRIEERVSAVLGLQARSYITPHPELALDVDKQVHVGPIEALLRVRAGVAQSLGGAEVVLE